MWIIYTLVTFACWGIADLFYKIGNKGENNYNHIKTGIYVGLVMGIHATIYLITNNLSIDIMEMIKYLPVSLLYILSMVIGYRGLKYLDLSISSPIQNTSGVITALLLILFFKEKYDFPFYIALVLIFIGIISLSINDIKANKKEREQYKKNNTKTKILVFTIIFPLLYCVLDGAGTFIDGIYLDKENLISEDGALLAYEYTFLVFALISWIYLKIKKEKLIPLDDKSKIAASIFETGGQFFYVYAMSGNSTVAAPIVGSYCILSFILSHIFLHERLSKKDYIAILLVIIGIVILSIMDV